MELNQLNKNFENIPQKQRKGVLNLIEYKTTENMEKVIQEIRRLETKIDALEIKMDTKINAIYWVLGVIGATITVIISIISVAIAFK